LPIAKPAVLGVNVGNLVNPFTHEAKKKVGNYRQNKERKGQYFFHCNDNFIVKNKKRYAMRTFF
jgi:hypothetical protein